MSNRTPKCSRRIHHHLWYFINFVFLEISLARDWTCDVELCSVALCSANKGRGESLIKLKSHLRKLLRTLQFLARHLISSVCHVCVWGPFMCQCLFLCVCHCLCLFLSVSVCVCLYIYLLGRILLTEEQQRPVTMETLSQVNLPPSCVN